MNGGGDESLAASFAGRFLAAPKVYSRDRIRRDGRWLGPFDRRVEPRPEPERYRGQVVVLLGPKTASSCESFVLMMRQAPGCRLVGDRTKGSSGNPHTYDLGIGVTVALSSWEDQLPDGSVLEGTGVTPDVPAKATPADLAEEDAVLEAALRLLHEGAGGPGNAAGRATKPGSGEVAAGGARKGDCIWPLGYRRRCG